MTKSHVTQEQHICQVCGHPRDTGSILMDNRLRQRFDRKTITGWSLCEEHQRLYDEGYVALVACHEALSKKTSNGHITPSDAHRTGEIAHMKAEVFAQMFTVPAYRESGKQIDLVFVSPAVIEMVRPHA